MLNSELNYRYFRAEEADLKNGVLPVAFSSETPVRCMGLDGQSFYEVLDHSPENADLSLLQDGGAFIDEHQMDRQIGSIKRAWIDRDKVGRALLTFADTSLGNERRTLMTSGHRKDISAGYRRTKELSRSQLDGIPLIRFAWKAFEISSVGVGADHFKTGVGRSQIREITVTEEKIPQMKTETQTEIIAIGKAIAHDHPHLADKIRDENTRAFLSDEISVADYKRSLMKLVQENPRPSNYLEVRGHEIGMGQKDIRNYCLARAIRSAAENNGKVDGFEKECSQQVEKNSGMRAEGFFVPSDAVLGMSRRDYQQRDMQATVFAAGGAFVPTILQTPIIELLRNRTVCTRLGCTVLAGLSGNVAFPREEAPATAYSVSEIGALTDSQQVLGQVIATPKRVGATTTFSKQLIMQSAPDAEAFIRDDVTKVVAIKHDSLLLNGQGSNSEPTGILNTPGVGSVTFGGSATWSAILAFEAALGNANADLGSIAWATTPNVKKAWKNTAINLAGATTVSSSRLWDKGGFNDGSNDGVVNEYRAASSLQIPNNLVLMGNWLDLVFCQWGGWDVVTDPYTKAKQAEIVCTVNTWIDALLRHPQSFVLSSDSGAQ